MGDFYGAVEVRKTGKQKYITLMDIGYENDEFLLTLNKGFETDGASIPKFLWSMVGSPFSGNYVFPAIIHDALYASGILSQKESDKLFLEMMEANGVGWWKRNTIYRGVRLGGWTAYMKSSDEVREKAQELIDIEMFE